MAPPEHPVLAQVLYHLSAHGQEVGSRVEIWRADSHPAMAVRQAEQGGGAGWRSSCRRKHLLVSRLCRRRGRGVWAHREPELLGDAHAWSMPLAQ